MAKRKAPTKTCPKCQAEVHAAKQVCDCGYKFKPKKKAAKKSAKPDDKISMSALVEAKKLAEKLGSLDEAKKAIDALSKLS